MVDIKGLNKAEVLKALYDHASVQGMGIFAQLEQGPEGKVTVEHCAELLKSTTYFDYLYGRVMKVDLSSDESFEEWLYDRDNGDGTAQTAIDEVRSQANKAEGE